MTELSFGGLTVEESQARAWVTAYLHDRSGVSAYPAYDSYKGTGRESRLLGDADLLAPVLLNVSQRPVRTYYSLQALTPALNEVLAVLPTDIALHEADDDVLAKAGSLYAVLDEVPKQPQVGMVKLSKVLARKRPGLIPIYDEAVRECYTDCDGAPVPRQDGRSREGYALALLRAARTDLARQLPSWEDLAALAPADRVEISPLRALDIVVWKAGQAALNAKPRPPTGAARRSSSTDARRAGYRLARTSLTSTGDWHTSGRERLPPRTLQLGLPPALCHGYLLGTPPAGDAPLYEQSIQEIRRLQNGSSVHSSGTPMPRTFMAGRVLSSW